MSILCLILTVFLPQNTDVFTVENGNTGQKPTLLFINGLGQDTLLWQDLVETLGKNWHCIRFDFPGIGKSPASDKPLTLDQMTQVCLDVIVQKQLGKVHIIGISLGSFTAQNLASKNPELIDSLILLSSTMGGSHHISPTAEALTFLMGQSGLEGAAKVKKGLELSLSQSFCKGNPEVLEKMGQNYFERKIDQNALTQQVFAGMSFDITKLVAFRGRTLIIHGKEDQLIPYANAQKLHQHLPHSKLVVIEQSGHLCHIDQKDQVIEAIENYLNNDVVNHSGR